MTASHWPAAHRRAAAAGQPGGAEQLRLQWLTALEVRGIRPYLDQQRMLNPACSVDAHAPPIYATTTIGARVFS
ncbi:hypothetical protein ABZV81_35205 [Streptomyces parvus]